MEDKKVKTIVFIIPFFGKWPNWIDYFWESCRQNPSIDFLIISDCERLQNMPSNFSFVKISFEEYKELVSQKLNIKFNPVNAYKICDVRPAFGEIHSDYINGYDFWGFCDIDLIWGNIRLFLTDQILNRYDLVTCFKRRISGHCTIIRNKSKYNQLYKRIDNWEEKFTSEKHYALDERDFTKIFHGFKNFPRPIQSCLKKIFIPLSRKALLKEQFSTPGARYAWTDGSYNFPVKWYWKHGKLTNDIDGKREFMYFHFLVWKKVWSINSITHAPISSSLNWEITEDGFSVK